MGGWIIIFVLLIFVELASSSYKHTDVIDDVAPPAAWSSCSCHLLDAPLLKASRSYLRAPFLPAPRSSVPAPSTEKHDRPALPPGLGVDSEAAAHTFRQ